MSQTWKTREETFHGSKWGYVVVALVIFIFLFLIWTVFAALRGYPFIEILPPSTALFFGSIFILYALVTGSVVTAGKMWSLPLAGSPLFVAIITVLAIAAIFVIMGSSAIILAVAAVILLVVLILLAWRSVIAMATSTLATIVLIILVLSYVSILIMLGYSIPTINVIIALIAFALLLIFTPFAIFIIDLFSLEHE